MRRSAEVLAPAAVVATLTAVDAVRQVQLGSADAATWAATAGTCVALGAAVLIGAGPSAGGPRC
jgi:hypothetical protein